MSLKKVVYLKKSLFFIFLYMNILFLFSEKDDIVSAKILIWIEQNNLCN